MPAPIPLLIAHPKELIRAGFITMLAGSPVKIIGEAKHADQIRPLLKKHKPKVALLNVTLPASFGDDSFELIRELLPEFPNTRFVLTYVLDNPTYIARAYALGVYGCLHEGVSRHDFLRVITEAAAGKPPKRSRENIKIAKTLAKRDVQDGPASMLTSREQQVLRHIAYGLSNEEIARSIEIRIDTVKEHVQNLLRKLGLDDWTKAAVWALKNARGLLE